MKELMLNTDEVSHILAKHLKGNDISPIDIEYGIVTAEDNKKSDIVVKITYNNEIDDE